MKRENYYSSNWKMEEEEEKEEQPKSDIGMFSKKLERYFFEKRAVYLWGVVDDKSAKDVVSKLLLLEVTSQVQKSNFISTAQVVWLPVVW